MPIDSEAVAAWITKNLAIDPGQMPVDYCSINRRATSRSWPQHARVEVAGRDALEVVADVLEHLSDLEHNAAAEGQQSYSVRLLLYRASGIPAGSRTFRAELPGQPFGEDGHAEEGDGTAQGEIVAVIRELRLLARDQGQQLERSSGMGFRLAEAALAQAGALQMENAGLMVAIAEAQGGSKDKGQMIAELAATVLPLLPSLLSAGQERRAQAADPDQGAEPDQGADIEIPLLPQSDGDQGSASESSTSSRCP